MSTVTLHEFHGGIHPSENKEQSTRTPIQSVALPNELVLSLRQSGRSSKPCVAVGEHVLKGQMIATATDFRSSFLHAPSSGVVSAIEPRLFAHSSGLTELSIVITLDGKDEWMEKTPFIQSGHAITNQALSDCAADALVEHIRQAGIIGLGGAGFPTSSKLSSSTTQPIDTLIINAAECEPYITADDMLMRERGEEVLQGTAILQHIVNAKRVLIGIEDNKPEATAALNRALNQLKPSIKALEAVQVAVIPTIYPSGSEKQLIKILTGEEVPSGGIPADIGVLCQNVGTAAAVYRAVYLGEPLISRITTLTGDAIAHSGNYDVLIGTPLEHLLAQAGYQPQPNARIIAGGPLMGFTLPSLAVSVSKTSNCFLAPTEDEIPLNDFAMECIRCGQCVEACPQELLPQQLYWFSKAEDYDKAEQHNIFDCIECGACSYVCPSHIPLVQYYRHTKGAMRLEAAAAAKAEQAKERYENRNARIERLAAEREAMRQARAEAKAKADAEAAAKAATEETVAPEQQNINEDEQAKQIDDLERKILAQKDRIKKSQERFWAAQAAELDTTSVLESAFLKQQDKLVKLEQELHALQQTVKEA